MFKYALYVENYFSSMGESEENYKRILTDHDEYIGVTLDKITCDFPHGNENNKVVEFLFINLASVISASEFLKILKDACRNYQKGIEKSEDRKILFKFID